jgi:hypothetical protein
MKRLTLLSVALAAFVYGQTPGMRPRPDAQSYAAKEQVPGATLAATALSAAQVKSAFGSDTYKGYLVVEVAIYPDSGGSFTVSPKDFMLKIGETGELLRPSAPATVALTIDERNNPQRTPDIRKRADVTMTSTIGYDSAGTYNPNTGRRQGAVYAGTEVDVSPGRTVPSQPHANKGRGFDSMEAELSDKALPEGSFSRPVAGFLYFQAPKKKASGNYNLDYLADAGRFKLDVPAPAK